MKGERVPEKSRHLKLKLDIAIITTMNLVKDRETYRAVIFESLNWVGGNFISNLEILMKVINETFIKRGVGKICTGDHQILVNNFCVLSDR